MAVKVENVVTRSIPFSGTQDLGIVYGTCCLSVNYARDIKQMIKNMVGGELKGYSEMMTQSLDIAKQRMIENANALNADGIYAVSIATPQVSGGAEEIIIYGTAFKYVI